MWYRCSFTGVLIIHIKTIFFLLFYPKFLSEVQQQHTEVSNQDCHFFIDDIENHNDYKADERSSY